MRWFVITLFLLGLVHLALGHFGAKRPGSADEHIIDDVYKALGVILIALAVLSPIGWFLFAGAVHLVLG